MIMAIDVWEEEETSAAWWSCARWRTRLLYNYSNEGY